MSLAKINMGIKRKEGKGFFKQMEPKTKEK
jgi:hypothetical protein